VFGVGFKGAEADASDAEVETDNGDGVAGELLSDCPFANSIEPPIEALLGLQCFISIFYPRHI